MCIYTSHQPYLFLFAVQAMKSNDGIENVAQAVRLSVHVISKIFDSLHGAYKGNTYLLWLLKCGMVLTCFTLTFLY